MNFFQLKLVPRLVLAWLVLVASTLLHWSVRWLYPEGEVMFGFLWYAWVPPFYDVALAMLVLVPYITASRWRWIRVIALNVVTGIVYFAAVYTVFHAQYAVESWNDTPHLRFVSLVPTLVVATWLLAFAIAWIGPLRVSVRFWIYTGLAGLVSGLAFWSAYTGDPSWFDLVPYWLWPVAICLAIYYGREQ